MKYLTTLEVAHQLQVSKQTLLNWLYDGKVPEPPRNRKVSGHQRTEKATQHPDFFRAPPLTQGLTINNSIDYQHLC